MHCFKAGYISWSWWRSHYIFGGNKSFCLFDKKLQCFYSSVEIWAGFESWKQPFWRLWLLSTWLYNINYFIHHVNFINIFLGEVVKPKILVKPNPARPFLIYTNHWIWYLKTSKSSKKPFKSKNSILQNKYGLSKWNLVKLAHFQWAVLIINSEVHSGWRHICTLIDMYENSFDNWELSLVPPFIDF